MIHSLITVLIRGNWPPSIFQPVSACSFLPFFLYLLFLSLWSSVQWQSKVRVRGRWALLSPHSFWPRGSWLLLLERPGSGMGQGLHLLGPLLDSLLPGQAPVFCFAALHWQWGHGCGSPPGICLGYTSLDERSLISPFFLGLVSSLPGQWSQWPCSHIHHWRW